MLQHRTKLVAEMSFDETLDLTAGLYFYFVIKSKALNPFWYCAVQENVSHCTVIPSNLSPKRDCSLSRG